MTVTTARTADLTTAPSTAAGGVGATAAPVAAQAPVPAAARTPGAPTTAGAGSARYLAPSRADRAFNRLTAWLARRGLSVAGSRELLVVGRTSGQVRSTVVNLLEVDGQRYLVAPRGHTQWARNLRAAGSGRFRLGRRTEAFTAVELPDDAQKVAVIRAYLERWAWEVGRFFDGIDAGSPDDAVLAAAPDVPVFLLTPA